MSGPYQSVYYYNFINKAFKTKTNEDIDHFDACLLFLHHTMMPVGGKNRHSRIIVRWDKNEDVYS